MSLANYAIPSSWMSSACLAYSDPIMAVNPKLLNPKPNPSEPTGPAWTGQFCLRSVWSFFSINAKACPQGLLPTPPVSRKCSPHRRRRRCCRTDSPGLLLKILRSPNHCSTSSGPYLTGAIQRFRLVLV